MLLNPINNTYVFLADDDQLSTLFMMTMIPPFVIGRVVYLNQVTDQRVLDFQRKYYCRVLKYDIAVVFEKTLVPYTSQDDCIFTINNMAHLFYSWRIKKNPEKYKQWYRPPC